MATPAVEPWLSGLGRTGVNSLENSKYLKLMISFSTLLSWFTKEGTSNSSGLSVIYGAIIRNSMVTIQVNALFYSCSSTEKQNLVQRYFQGCH